MCLSTLSSLLVLIGILTLSALLNDNHFKNVFRLFLFTFEAEKHTFESLQSWWEYGKIQIKQQ